MEFQVVGIERERGAEFVDVRIAGGQKLAGALGDGAFGTAGGGEQGGVGFGRLAEGFTDASEVEQEFAEIGAEGAGGGVFGGGEREVVALLGQAGQFEVGAEVGGGGGDDAGPALDAIAQGAVDVFESSGGGGVALAAVAVEDAAGDGGLAGFVAEEGILEGGVRIGGVQTHGFAELVAGGFGFAHLEPGVGQILMNTGAVGTGGDGLAEEADGVVVIAILEAFVGGVELGVAQRGSRRGLHGRRLREDATAIQGCEE